MEICINIFGIAYSYHFMIRSSSKLPFPSPLLLSPVVQPDGVTALAFNLVGDWLMVGFANGGLQLWDTQQRSLLKTITEHQVSTP
jgi:hypothetical protein